MGIPPITTGAPHHLVTHHIGMMAGMGVYRRKRIVAGNDFPIVADKRVFHRILFVKLHCGFSVRKGGYMKSALDGRSEEFATNFVSDDAHVETKIDLDARMESEL